MKLTFLCEGRFSAEDLFGALVDAGFSKKDSPPFEGPRDAAFSKEQSEEVLLKFSQSPKGQKRVQKFLEARFQGVGNFPGFRELETVGSLFRALDFFHVDSIEMTPLALGSAPSQKAALLLAKGHIPWKPEGEELPFKELALLYALSPKRAEVICGRFFGFGGSVTLFLEEELHREWMVEVNLDDMTGEDLAYLGEKLWEANPKDIFWTPIHMKKNRPAVCLSVLTSEEGLSKVEEILLKESSTFGLRRYPVVKRELPRTYEKIETPFGELTLKVGNYPGGVKRTFEYEELRKIAEEKGLSLREIREKIGRFL